jgi:hypothetical protein
MALRPDRESGDAGMTPNGYLVIREPDYCQWTVPIESLNLSALSLPCPTAESGESDDQTQQ